MRESNGRFGKGNTFSKGKGRKKGSLGALNKAMIARFAELNEINETSPIDVIYGLMIDTTMTPEVKLKAASKLVDMLSKTPKDEEPEQQEELTTEQREELKQGIFNKLKDEGYR